MTKHKVVYTKHMVLGLYVGLRDATKGFNIALHKVAGVFDQCYCMLSLLV